MPEIAPGATRGKAATSISVTSASPTGFRGEVIHVEGAVTGAGAAGLPYLRVDIYLAPAGRGGEDARLVGHGQTDAAGRYATDVTVPADIELQDHEVFATTPGDDAQQPAQSR
jgi:protocatechuate 3,4-dioxygenase beta subunit